MNYQHCLKFSRCLFGAIFIGYAVACAPIKVAKKPSVSDAISNSQAEDAQTQVITSSGLALSIQEILEKAQIAQEASEYEKALEFYSLAVQAAQLETYQRTALIGQGASYDALGRFKEALRSYKQSLLINNEERDFEVEVRIVRLLTHLEDYRGAALVASQVPLATRPALEQVALLVAGGLGALSDDNEKAARDAFAAANQIVRERGYGKWQSPPQDLAGLYFGQAELLRLSADAIDLHVDLENFPAQVETRCQALLDAQTQYSQVLRVGSAHWSAMAGVRVAQLYTSLHDELIQAARLAPTDSEEERALVEGALRLRYSVLLRKAVALMRTTLTVVQRTDSESVWGKKAELALADLEKNQAKEQRLIAELPYTRKELQKMLDELSENED